MEKKIEVRKDILTKLIKGNLLLGGVKVGTMLVPKLSIIGFVVPQFYITFFLLLTLSTVVLRKSGSEGKQC